MPVYVFESPSGKRIERSFPIGTAPRKIGRYERVVSFPRAINFVGGAEAGWASAKPEHKVSWATVAKHIDHCNVARRETQKKHLKHLKTLIADHL